MKTEYISPKPYFIRWHPIKKYLAIPLSYSLSFLISLSFSLFLPHSLSAFAPGVVVYLWEMLLFNRPECMIYAQIG